MEYVPQNIEKMKNIDGAGLFSCLDRPGAMYYGSQTTPTLVLRCHAFRTEYLAKSMISPGGVLGLWWDSSESIRDTSE